MGRPSAAAVTVEFPVHRFENLLAHAGFVQHPDCRASGRLRAQFHYIPKTDGRQRPLGVASLEDKIVQQAVFAKRLHRHRQPNRSMELGIAS